MCKRIISSMAAVLLLAGALTAQPAQKNTYYDDWTNAGVLKNADFFPIAVWYQPVSRIDDYAATGVNMYIGPSISSASHLTTLKDNDMYCIAKYSNTLRDATDAARVLGWEHQDEPDNDQNGAGCVDTTNIQALYRSWTTQDPSRPIYLNLGKGVADIYAGLRGTCSGDWEMYPGYIRGCDIASYDIYPCNDEAAAVNQNLWYVAKGIDSLRSWSNFEKPAWCWIECTLISDGSMSGVKPTTKQVRSEVWQALIHEAAGFGYFCHSWSPTFQESAWLGDPPMKAEITKINTEVGQLARALNSPTIMNQVETASSWRTPVETMLKAEGGYTYLFADCNRRGASTNTVTFTVTGLPSSCTAEVIGEGRSITITDGVFQDEYDEWAVHLYKIDATVAIEESPATVRNLLNRGIAVTVLPDGTVRIVKHVDLAGRNIAVSIRDAAGRVVAVPEGKAGYGTLEWSPAGAAAGVYFVTIDAGAASLVRPVVIH